MMEYKFDKILIIQPAFIGDVILSTSIMQQLRNFYPAAAIDILVKKGNEEVVTDQPFADEVIVFDKTKKIKNLFRLLLKIRKTRYDLVVNLNRFFSSGFLTAFSGAAIKQGFKKNPFSFFFTNKFPHDIGSNATVLHEIERNNLLIEKYTRAIPSKPVLYFSKEVLSKVSAYKTQQYVCIAPASVWYTKQLPEEKWLELIKCIPVETIIYLLGAPSDRPLCERIKNNCGRANVTSLAGNLSLKQSAALIKDASINFVNDSAPLHLASAVNAPVCAVFCSTVPEFGFGPLSDYSKVVQVNYPLECKPCNLHGYRHCPKGHFKCGKDIDVKDLYKAFNGVVG
jgi:lipopolysaccharide heptosyltransferase II